MGSGLLPGYKAQNPLDGPVSPGRYPYVRLNNVGDAHRPPLALGAIAAERLERPRQQAFAQGFHGRRQAVQGKIAHLEALSLARTWITIDLERLIDGRDLVDAVTVGVGVREFRPRAQGEEPQPSRDQSGLLQQLPPRRLLQRLAELLEAAGQGPFSAVAPHVQEHLVPLQHDHHDPRRDQCPRAHDRAQPFDITHARHGNPTFHR